MTSGPVPVAQHKSRFPLSLRIAAALLLGLVVGPMIGSEHFATFGGPLGEVGKLVIGLIKAVAAPLLFLAIVNAVTKTEVAAKDGVRMLGFAVLNASIALGIGLVLSNLIQPGAHMAAHAPAVDVNEYAGKKIDFVKTLASYVPQNLLQPFVDNAVLPIVIIALLVGFGMRRVRKEQGASSVAVVEEGAAALLRVTEVVLRWVIQLIPFAVFAVVARSVAEHGYEPFRGLGMYLFVGLLGLALHVGITYNAWIGLASPLSLRTFWREAREPVVYAVGANSSLATLPLTLRALDRLGVSRSSSTLGACVGTNLNNDGILLYEGMAVLFVAQASGIDLSLGQQVGVALTCVVAAMGVAGVPEAGFISLALVLNTAKLPVEILPLLLTVDWVIARARSVVNVLSDMVLSTLIDLGNLKRAAADSVSE